MEQPGKEQFSSAKQKLSLSQLNIKKSFKDGKSPAEEDFRQFMSSAREMCRLGKNEWQEGMDRFRKLLAQFEEAIDAKSMDSAKELFHHLIENKESCHKQFRKK